MSGKAGTFTLVSPTHYVMTIPKYGITFDLDRVRRERHEFWGELIVTCTLKAARTIDGVLSAADFNLSGQLSRGTRAKFLAERSQAPEIDWTGLIEEFCQRVITFDRAGTDAPALCDVPLPVKGGSWTIDGLTLLERHPAVLFGDGGQGKSLLALHLVGKLAQQGISVLYCDWEFDGESHRERYGGLFGASLPTSLRYARCDKPLAAEADRLRRLVQQYQIQYLVCDSIVFACAPGVPAESAEAAATYYQALRQIGIGSLNLAHTTKSNSDTDEKRQQAKPFGSVFWANGARATWFLKGVSDGSRLTVGVYPRKANTGALGQSLGWTVDFRGDTIRLASADIAAHGELGKTLRVWERIRHELQHGAQTPSGLAENLEVPLNTIVQELKRKHEKVVKLPRPDGTVQKYGLIDDTFVA